MHSHRIKHFRLGLVRGILEFLALCWLGVLSLTLSARGANFHTNYQVDVWQREQGLPQNSVTTIKQTSDGYLWLGTQDGLVRFDGLRFQLFDQNNTPAIKNSRIVQLFEDREQALWIGTEQGGVVCLRGGEFSRYEMPSRGTAHNYARVFCNDLAGSFWLVSCEWQLMRFADSKLAVPSANWELAGVRCLAVAANLAGQVWVGTERELAVWRDGKFQAVFGGTNEDSLQVDYLKASQSNGCWVAANGRLRKFDAGQWVTDLGSYDRINHPIYDLHEDRDGCLWMASMGNGLFRFAPNGEVLHLTTKEGLPSDFVRCVIEDREGNIWAGTEGGGLCRLKPATFTSFGTRQGLSSDQVVSVFEAKAGEMWIGMNGDGLDRLTGTQVDRFGAEQGLMNGHVWSVVEDRHGVVWAGTWDGLFRLDQNRFAPQTDGTNIGWQVFGMFEDSQGALWLGQQAFGALTRLHDGQRTVIKIPGASSSLDVRVMVEDRDGNLWIGTNDDGLYRMNKDGSFTHFGRRDGLGSEAIWSLKVDADDGSLWIGTCRGGLSRWHQDRITTWTAKDGLINNVICQILEDRRGNLWLGSHGGVFRVSKTELNDYASGQRKTIQCVGYGKAEGLPSLECQGGFQPSGCKTRDGRLWFPTVKGLAVVNPETIVRNPLSPLVVIEEMLVDGAAQPLKTEAKAASYLAGQSSGALKISPGKQRVDFRYTALSYTAPEAVRFKYRLDGLEQDWLEAGTTRTVNYSHVPPGNYRFQVIACNSEGVWNETGDTLAITVLPYFWQTKLFLGLATLVTLGIVAGLVRRIEARKLQRQLELAERERAIERERTRIANDIHDDLGANLTEIAILSELAENPAAPPAQASADVRKIAVKARELTRSLDEIVWAVNPQYDTLDSLVTYSCDFAQDYLQLAGVVCRMEIPTRLPEVQLTADVRHNLLMTLKEALNNIVKHAGASEVQIKVVLEPELFTLTIRDNGKGFQLDQFPTPVNAAATQSTRGGMGGNGLPNMRQRIENIGGKFKLESQPNQGTLVTLAVNLKGEMSLGGD